MKPMKSMNQNKPTIAGKAMNKPAGTFTGPSPSNPQMYDRIKASTTNAHNTYPSKEVNLGGKS